MLFTGQKCTVAVVFAALLFACGDLADDGKNVVSDISKHLVVSRACDRIAYSSNQLNYYSPVVLSGYFSGTLVEPTTIKIGRHAYPVSLSMDCRFLALAVENTAAQQYDIFLHDFQGQKTAPLFASPQVDEGVPMFSPTDTRLAYLANGKLKIFDYAGNTHFEIEDHPTIHFIDLQWSYKGTYLFLEDNSHRIWSYSPSQKLFNILVSASPATLNRRMISPIEGEELAFHFLSDYESNFNQIYKFNSGRISLTVSSDSDKYLFQRPYGPNLFYRISRNGFHFLGVKGPKGMVPLEAPQKGVVYDFFPDSINGNIILYADDRKPISVFRLRANRLESLDVEYKSMDSLNVTAVTNKDGMVNYVYLPANPKRWVVWLHGGPHDQMLRRYNTYIVGLVEAGNAVIVLNYRGSTGIGNTYEMRSWDRKQLLRAQIESVRSDLTQVLGKFPVPNDIALVGVSYGAVVAHEYAYRYPGEISRLVDFSGIASNARTPAPVPTLFIYGEHDYASTLLGRAKLFDHYKRTGGGVIHVLKDEGHSVKKRENIAIVLKTIISFLENST